MNWFSTLRTYIIPGTIVAMAIRYITWSKAEDTTTPDSSEPESTDVGKFEIMLPTKLPTPVPVPMVYSEYIDEAVVTHADPEFILHRMPDYSIMSIYLARSISPDEMTRLMIPIHIKRMPEGIVMWYQNKIYYWHETTIYGPDADILPHFKSKYNLIIC